MLKKVEGEWKLMSKSKPDKVLKNFGKTKPSQEAVNREEGRIHFYKNKGG